MSNVSVLDQPRAKSVLIDMADRYGMEAAAFEATVRQTCIKPDKNGRVASREEFAAFLLVAKNYKLNPLTKEIYAFAGKGGGVVPIVSIDGWANLINSNPQFDGLEFDDSPDEKNGLSSITCRIFRKDRSHAVSVTEYMAECRRDTETWRQWPRRMLRHKALIQAARYAFGFAGIYDEDEGERIVSARDITPSRTPRAPPPIDAIAAPAKVATPISEAAKPKTPPNPNAVAAQPAPTVESILAAFKAKLDAATDQHGCDDAWDSIIEASPIRLSDGQIDDAQAMLRESAQRFYETSE